MIQPWPSFVFQASAHAINFPIVVVFRDTAIPLGEMLCGSCETPKKHTFSKGKTETQIVFLWMSLHVVTY